MNSSSQISVLLLDIGGVLLNNAWDSSVRKPDKNIYRLSLYTGQAIPEETAYIDDRLLFAEVAKNLGIASIDHTDLITTKTKLGAIGLTLE